MSREEDKARLNQEIARLKQKAHRIGRGQAGDLGQLRLPAPGNTVCIPFPAGAGEEIAGTV